MIRKPAAKAPVNGVLKTTSTSSDESKKLISWLSPVDDAAIYKDIIESPDRIEGIGTWLPQHPKFLQWQPVSLHTTGKSFMLLTGPSGSGKTHLATLAIAYFLQQRTGDILLYHYCRPVTQCGRLQEVICALLAQLVSALSNNKSTLSTLYALKQEGKRPETVKDFARVLTPVLEQHKVTIIIDALDRCNRQGADLGKWLCQYSARDPLYGLRALVTASATLDGGEGLHISLRKDIANPQVEKDMDALARTLLLRCYKNWNMAKDKVDMVIRSLLASETASLRFIAYAVRHVLRDCRSIGDVQRTVQRLRLGSGLEDAYRAILDKVLQGDESVAKLVKRVFVWLLGTQRPLTAEELWEAILIDRKSDGSVDVTVEQRWFDQHRLFQDHCYGMVEHSNKSGKVVLADMSVQEFLPNYTGPGNDKPFADRRVRLVTAKAVVSYAILDLKDPRGDHPLRGYASATLADHLLSVGIPDRRLLDLTLQFVGTLLERQHGLSSPWKFGWKMLSTITSGPFLSVARALNPKWLNADIPAYGCTPLMLAVDHQDFKAVEALVRTLRVNIKQKSRIPNYRSTEQDKDVKVEPSVYARRKQSQTIRDLLG